MTERTRITRQLNDEDSCIKCGEVRRMHTAHGRCKGPFIPNTETCRHCWHTVGQHTDEGCALAAYCGCAYTEAELLRLS